VGPTDTLCQMRVTCVDLYNTVVDSGPVCSMCYVLRDVLQLFWFACNRRLLCKMRALRRGVYSVYWQNIVSVQCLAKRHNYTKFFKMQNVKMFQNVKYLSR